MVSDLHAPVVAPVPLIATKSGVIPVFMIERSSSPLPVYEPIAKEPDPCY